MKLNLEVELDWIDEEMNLDDTIKQSIISSVVGKIQGEISKRVEKEINASIDATVLSVINGKTESVFDDFMNREICISDRYGDKIKVYPKMEDLIKERFDNFMTQMVDESGKTTDSSYGTRSRRIDFVVDNQLKKFADKFTTDTVKRVSEEIRLHVADGLQTKLGSELMKVLKVDKMLEISK